MLGVSRSVLTVLAATTALVAVAWLLWRSPREQVTSRAFVELGRAPSGEAAAGVRLRGLGGPAANGPEGDAEEAAHDTTSIAEGEPTGGVGDLVLVAASTDRDSYGLFEPVRVRRVFENPSDRPVLVRADDWGRPSHRDVVLASPQGSRLYEPSTHELAEVVVPPGERVTNEVLVELATPGVWTIEVPPEYLTRGTACRCIRLTVTVADEGDPRHAAAKAERLVRAIAAENPECPTCWSEAQKELQHMGVAALADLRRWVRESSSPYVRAVAAKILGPLVARGEGGLEDLVAGLEDADPGVRRMCVQAVSASHERVSLDVLLARLQDTDVWVRVEAIEAIARAPDPRASAGLVERLKDSDDYVQLRAAVALAESKRDATGIRVLVAALEADPVDSPVSVIPALEALTGRSFGKARWAGLASSQEMAEQTNRANAVLIERWLEWWKAEGLARYGER